MDNYYEETCTRMYDLDLVKQWAKAEEDLGLTKSIFISIGGIVTQFIDSKEGEKFHKELKEKLEEELYFGEVCDYFLNAIKEKKIVNMFRALAVFNEIDEYPEIANAEILRKLMEIRVSTESEIYKFKKDHPVKDFILFCGEVHLKEES